MEFEFPIKRQPGNFDCACCNCDNDPVMHIGEERYCYECGVPVLAVNWRDAEFNANLHERIFTSLQVKITKLTTERNRLRHTLRYLFYARTACGQKIEDFVDEVTARRVLEDLNRREEKDNAEQKSQHGRTWF